MRVRLALIFGLFSARPASAKPCQRSAYVIALDSGHSPGHSGARSARGKTEYAFNRRLTLEALDALHAAGFTQAFHVNPKDEDLSLTTRTRRAAQAHAEVFISLHHDSVQDRFLVTWKPDDSEQRYSDRAAGFSLFIHNGNAQAPQSRALAEDLGRRLRAQGLTPNLHHAEAIDGERRELLEAQLGLYRFDQLAVLKTAQSPAVLLEAGVIVNRDEEVQLENARYRKSITHALVQTVVQACERPSTPVQKATSIR